MARLQVTGALQVQFKGSGYGLLESNQGIQSTL